MKRITLVTLLLFSLLSSAPIWAQDPEPVEEIIARGTIQTDPAMSAWNAGDFATAEIEFKRNAFCALRAERNFTSGVESARDNSIRSDVAVDAVGPPQVSGGQGGVIITPSAPPPSPVTRLNSSDFKNEDSPSTRTCEDRGFQLYMMGMSQLKLGKREDAKKTLIRAANMRKNLSDAHFRLSLLEYQDGNIDKAKKHLKKLHKLESRCRTCKAKDEMKAQLQYLKNLLG